MGLSLDSSRNQMFIARSLLQKCLVPSYAKMLLDILEPYCLKYGLLHLHNRIAVKIHHVYRNPKNCNFAFILKTWCCLALSPLITAVVLRLSKRFSNI